MLQQAVPAVTNVDEQHWQGLVREARGGDPEAWRAIFDEHYPKVFRYLRSRIASHEQAEDLTSDVFLEAHRSIGNLRWQRRPIGAWLFGIAKNRLASHYRSARREGSVAPGAADIPFAQDDYLSIEIRDLLSRIAPEQRLALELRWVVGLSGEEAAAAMGRSHGAFRTILYRAGQEFRRISGEAQGGN